MLDAARQLLRCITRKLHYAITLLLMTCRYERLRHIEIHKAAMLAYIAAIRLHY